MLKRNQKKPNPPSRIPSVLTVAALALVPLMFACVEEGPGEPPTADQELQKDGKADSFGQQTEDVRGIDPSNCSHDRSDDFDSRARLPKGPWEGDCLDTTERRPAVVLKEATADDPILTVANVFHGDGYWVAAIPTDAVEDVYFQLEYFPAIVPAGHTQLRVRFAKPVELVGQSGWNQDQRYETQDLILSIEAVPRVGDSYDILKGTRDHFGLVLRITSLAARYDSMITQQGHHVEQWILQMTEDEKQALLPFYAFESETVGLNETYHTLFRNCTTEVIGTLDAVVKYTIGENIKRFLVGVTEMYPNVVRTALIARGLLPLNQSTDWHALEDDPTAAHLGRE